MVYVAVAEKAKLVGDVARIETSMKDMEEEAGVAYVQTKEREAAVEANKGALETARAEVRDGPSHPLVAYPVW